MKCFNCKSVMISSQKIDELERFQCPNCGWDIIVKTDKMLPISEGLLEDIRHELVTLSGLKATDTNCPGRGYISLNVNELIQLDFADLIKQIDMVLKK